MEEQGKFSGMRMVVGACAYMLLVMSVAGVHVPIYGMLPDYFGTDLVGLSFAVVACSAVAIVGSLFGGKILRAIGPRGAMIVGGICCIGYGVVCSLIHSVVAFGIGMACLGLLTGLAAHGCVVDLIMRWYIKDRASMISVILGITMFGTALGSTVATAIISAGFTISQMYLMVGIAFGVAAIAVAVLVIRNNPEDIGQVALGKGDSEYDIAPAAAPMQEAGEKRSFKDLYTSPTFILMCVGILGATAGAANISGMLSVFVPTVGGEATMAATFVSVMSYLGAAAMLLSGKLIEKVGTLRYVIIVLAGCLVANGTLLFLTHDASALVPLLCVVTLGYAFGSLATNIHNMLNPIVFTDPVLASEANTKMIACMNAGVMILNPVMSGVIANHGFTVFYSICVVLNLLCVVCFVGAMLFAKKGVVAQTVSQAA